MATVVSVARPLLARTPALCRQQLGDASTQGCPISSPLRTNQDRIRAKQHGGSFSVVVRAAAAEGGAEGEPAWKKKLELADQHAGGHECCDCQCSCLRRPIRQLPAGTVYNVRSSFRSLRTGRGKRCTMKRRVSPPGRWSKMTRLVHAPMKQPLTGSWYASHLAGRSASDRASAYSACLILFLLGRVEATRAATAAAKAEYERRQAAARRGGRGAAPVTPLAELPQVSFLTEEGKIADCSQADAKASVYAIFDEHSVVRHVGISRAVRTLNAELSPSKTVPATARSEVGSRFFSVFTVSRSRTFCWQKAPSLAVVADPRRVPWGADRPVPAAPLCARAAAVLGRGGAAHQGAQPQRAGGHPRRMDRGAGLPPHRERQRARAKQVRGTGRHAKGYPKFLTKTE